ncbi:MAG: hypothetical protein JWN51_2231 [Phycisphaerales bacterium]|nr:hypothetical protein [Phycisphaerales bacterium]
MLRRLLTPLSALSLLLCVGVCVLWVRSYGHWEWAAYQDRGGRTFTVTSRLGAAVFDVTDGWPPGIVAAPFRVHSGPLYASSLPPPNRWYWLGLGFDRATQSIGVSGTPLWTGTATSASLVVPHGFLCLLTAYAPASRAWGLYRRRVRPGLCSSCGYDLRASPDRCPECGTVR